MKIIKQTYAGAIQIAAQTVTLSLSAIQQVLIENISKFGYGQIKTAYLLVFVDPLHHFKGLGRSLLSTQM
jgi:hypothetical protein